MEVRNTFFEIELQNHAFFLHEAKMYFDLHVFIPM